MQPWPKPIKPAVKERSSERTPELRSRPELMRAESGLKGQDERHSPAPLTPLPTPTPHFALDTANVVRDVKPSIPANDPSAAEVHLPARWDQGTSVPSARFDTHDVPAAEESRGAHR